MQKSLGAAEGNFRPSWLRFLFAFGASLGCFFIPQEVPLVWYPLNNPGNDIYYLEITCAANQTGNVQIFCNLTQGINELDSIQFPISATTKTYTYTFPLPDAPITELRLDPVNKGGTLVIRQMRIINRRNEEIRRFTYDMFRAVNQIAAIRPSKDGWEIVSNTDADDPYTRIELYSPIVSPQLSHRNFLRCTYSTGYLALMLSILLLAVLFTFYRPTNWQDCAKHVGFMACLALLFSFVGNRGLIKNSIHYAQYMPPPIIPDELRLEFDLTSSSPTPIQLFYDTGKGFTEEESVRSAYEPHAFLQTARFPLPKQPIKNLRFDPRDNPGSVLIRGIRIVDSGQRTRAVLPIASFQAIRDISTMEPTEEGLLIKTVDHATDPILFFSSESIAIVNQALSKK